MKHERRPPTAIAMHFSVGMLSRFALESGAQVLIEPLTKAEAIEQAQLCLRSWGNPRSASAVGYANNATVLTAELGLEVIQNRTTILLDVGDSVVLCAFEGGRLPEFATALPADAGIRYFLVSIEELDEPAEEHQA